MLWTIIVWVIIGLIAGWAASHVVEGTGLGVIGDIVVGLIGALIGGFILGGLLHFQGAGVLWSIVTAFIGAVILLLIVRALSGGRRGRRGRYVA